MNPVITQAIAAERTRDWHAEAAAARRARLVRRPRTARRIASGLRALRPVPAHAA